MASLLYRLGRFAARRHWYVIVAWILVLALGGVAYSVFAGAISSSISIPGTATAKVQDELTDKFPNLSGGIGTIVFATTGGSSFTKAQKEGVEAFLSDIGKVKGVDGTQNPFASQAQLDGQKRQLADGAKKVEAAKQQIADGQEQLDAQSAKLDQAQSQLDAQKSQGAPAQVAAAQSQIDAGRQQAATAQKAINDNSAKLEANEREVTQASALLELTDDYGFVSNDGSAALASVSFTTSTYQVPPASKTKIGDLAEHAGIHGVDVEVSNEIAEGVPSILGPGEIVGVLIAAIVLVIMLGTIIGAALPLVSAILGVGVATLGAMSFSSLVEFDSLTTVLGVMLGLAVGIDYSLFILNRHRSQLKRGMEVHESIGLANGTSGNAVVFAGTTVIVALLALNITGIPFLGLMGTVGAVAVAIAIIVATTFTPALMSLLGTRLLRKKERAAIGSAADSRVPDKPMNTWRAVITLVLGVAVLGTIALPATQMRLGLPDGSSEATTSSQYHAFKTVESKFGSGRNGPLIAVATMPAKVGAGDVSAAEVTIGQAVAASADVAAVLPVGASSDRTIIAFQVVPKGGPSSVSTENLVKDLRAVTVKVEGGTATLGVAGNASANIDVSEKLAAALPLYLAVVVGLSLLILILVFRSFLVPITATAGFVLSLLAAFGGLTAIYQFGWLGPVFGVHDPAPILSFLPVIEVGVLFGLAMDYQLFLVSGMREAYVHGASAKVAVQRGVHAARSVVTAAAIIMIAIFAGFIFSDSSMIKPIGFALAFGALVDAFVVRMLLIPAAMHLLGASAWWFPKWLDRIMPDVDVEGAKLEGVRTAFENRDGAE